MFPAVADRPMPGKLVAGIVSLWGPADVRGVLVMPEEMRADPLMVERIVPGLAAAKIEWTDRVERRDVPALPAQAVVVEDPYGRRVVVVEPDRAAHEIQELVREPGVVSVSAPLPVSRLVGWAEL